MERILLSMNFGDNVSKRFSSYDFFGYLLPGIISFLVVLFCTHNLDLPLLKLLTKEDLIQILKETFLLDNGITSKIIGTIVLLTSLYFTGHIVACFSHIIFDRIIVRNSIGYPIPFIIKTDARQKSRVQTAYTTLIILGLIFLAYPIFFYVFPNFQMAEITIKLIITISLTIIIVRGIQIFLSLYRVNRKSWRITRKIAYMRFMKFIFRKPLIDMRFISTLFYLPFRKFTSTDSPINEDISKRFKSKFETIFKFKPKQYDSDAYWLAYIAISNDSNTRIKLNNWLNLYGCLRNYSCVMSLTAFFIASNIWYTIIFLDSTPSFTDSLALMVFIFLMFILFVKYWIIYFNYYSKYIVRTFAYYQDINVVETAQTSQPADQS